MALSEALLAGIRRRSGIVKGYYAISEGAETWQGKFVMPWKWWCGERLD